MHTRIFCLLACLAIFNLDALADWDPELERQEQAQAAAARAEAARKDAEIQAVRHAAEIKAKREMLGKSTQGKSDAEVSKLYDQFLNDSQAQALQMQKQGAALGAQMMQREQETRAERDAAMKQMTGKSTGDLMQMSDEDLDKFAAEMEQKYGEK